MKYFTLTNMNTVRQHKEPVSRVLQAISRQMERGARQFRVRDNRKKIESTRIK